MVRIILLVSLLALTLGGCPGSIISMSRQVSILSQYSGGPDNDRQKEPDYQDCNMQFGTTGSRMFSADPPPAVHDCMKQKGYTVNTVK